MSTTISEATGKPYGVQRVCDTWEMPRSSYYKRKDRTLESPVLQKRGPKTLISDDELLTLIRDDLATSLFIGEGHRKVWGRIRFIKEIKVGRKRVLRIMQQNNLLSPHRVVQGEKQEHKGKISTQVPNDMWGTDGTKIFTIDDGWCWLFTAVEHWNAALQPLSMAVNQRFGSVGKDAARGLTLRMDNGSQYLSEHFQNQIKFWGIAPSFAFVSQPQTNGVAERFNRTLKEQVVYGRTYRNIEELRVAVTAFMERYNQHWLVEKLGYRSPNQAYSDFYNDQQKEAA
jgi:putative transposase